MKTQNFVLDLDPTTIQNSMKLKIQKTNVANCTNSVITICHLGIIGRLSKRMPCNFTKFLKKIFLTAKLVPDRAPIKYFDFSPYRHGYLNVYPFNMNDCECTKKFKQCLLDLDTDLAKELHRLYFLVMNLKCFTFVPRKICVQYSKWFDSCEDYINYVDLEIHDT